MISWSVCNIKKFLFSMLILSGLTLSIFSQDKNISGIINVYKHVTAIGPGTDNVTLSDVNSIQAGDTVLLIQMKGVNIYVPESASYGTPQDTVGAPGSSEFLIVQSVNTGAKIVTFRNDILKQYNISGAVQLIKVPFYNSAKVIADLTCQPWDSINKTGGVLAMIVSRTLSLDANIDVTGKGFAGGAATLGDGICTINADDKYSYPESFTNSGYKGESQVTKAWLDVSNIISYYPGYTKGKGANFTGGGGGNGKFAGGGGGSNYGNGGLGGVESGTCGAGNQAGNGLQRHSISTYPDLIGGIFLGGGGGGSTHLSGSTASPGGKGGGIIIIMCDTLKGNGRLIKADGEMPSIFVGINADAGAGGGGGGGSIALYQQSFSTVLSTSALTVSANGGKGGSTGNSFGEGGGGGGGLILTNDITFPANVLRSITGGVRGDKASGSTGGTAGSDGEMNTNYAPLLNGFLFNSVRSSVTGNLIDSICSNVPFGLLTGTQPVGGVAPYTFLWKSSTISEAAGFAAASGTNNAQNYSPGTLTQTTWFRRVVTDSNTPALSDISKPVKIIVQEAITGNIVGNDTTICFNQNPLSLVPLNSGPANGSAYNYYEYKWVQNLTNTNWTSLSTSSAIGTFINPSYNPPALTDTTYYERVVTSGRCVDYSPTVKITVLPLITGNITARPDSVICEGSLFNPLGASAPGGGDLINYWYKWQDSITSGSWVSSPNVNAASVYTADTSKFSTIENRYFRRIVYSGPDSVCRSNSSPIKLTRFHKIKNNLIFADQTICSGNAPLALTGSVTTQGSGVYSYVWQDSSKAVSWTTKGITDFSFSPAALTDTTWYRRIVNSSKCTNVSSLVQINVHKPILNNKITLISGGADTTICNGAVPNLLKGTVPTGGSETPGDYAYLWFVSTDNVTWNPAPGTGTGANYQPPALPAAIYYYKRQVSSGACLIPRENSETITITVLPSITNNLISGKSTVCYNTDPALLTGSSPGGGDGTYSYFWEQSPDGSTWVPAGGTNNSSIHYQPPSLTAPVKYRRTVRSGATDCCINISPVFSLGIDPLPTGTITSITDTTICEGSKVRLDISLTGASAWKVIYLENSAQIIINNIAGNDTSILISPVTAGALSTFNYSLFSVEDQNGCFATSLTGSRKADVYKVPVAVAGPDAVVCGPTVTLKATPSVGTGIWISPAAVVASTPDNPLMTVTVDSLFSGGSTNHTFTWEEINWQCKSKDSVVITFDKRVTKANAGPADTTLYSFDNIFHMVADPVSNPGWETGGWSLIYGTGSFDDTTKNDAKVADLSDGLNSFLWTVRNGKCKFEDKIEINISGIKIPKGFSPNNDQINDIFIIKGLDLLHQQVELKIVNGAGAEVFSTSNYNCMECWTEWEGKNSKGIDLPEGTYYYLLKMTSDPKNGGTGKVIKRSGFIILKRK